MGTKSIFLQGIRGLLWAPTYFSWILYNQWLVYVTIIKFSKGYTFELVSNISLILYQSTLLLPIVRTHWYLACNVIKQFAIMKKNQKDYFWNFLPFFFFVLLSITAKLQIADFFFLLSFFFGGGEWVCKEGGDSDLCQGLKNCGGLFLLQMTATSVHNNIRQPDVPSNRNQVSCWTGWMIATLVQQQQAQCFCCPNQSFSKPPHHITWASVSWGTPARWATELLTPSHSCFQKAHGSPLAALITG